MNLRDIETEYLNRVENMGKERPESNGTVQTFYELMLYKDEPKIAYKKAMSGFRAIIYNLNK
jgi:hypothetical protein